MVFSVRQRNLKDNDISGIWKAGLRRAKLDGVLKLRCQTANEVISGKSLIDLPSVFISQSPAFTHNLSSILLGLSEGTHVYAVRYTSVLQDSPAGTHLLDPHMLTRDG